MCKNMKKDIKSYFYLKFQENNERKNDSTLHMYLLPV